MIDPEGGKMVRERYLLEQLADLRGAEVAAVLYYPTPSADITGAFVVDEKAGPKARAFLRHIQAAASKFK